MRIKYLACLLLLLLSSSTALADEAAEASLPVILPTGFEPFGDGRLPNPSWEGIKKLDGKTWEGHRLVARQLPVMWGMPQERLESWIEELSPVAIFSFGQGGGYALETLASNRRGSARDNSGLAPASPEIVTGGPASLAATIDAEKLTKQLAEQGYRVAISRDAGKYLCEECLYTLEYLKQQRKVPGTVLFCHLPRLEKDHYEAADVERFVMQMLSAWRAVYPPAK